MVEALRRSPMVMSLFGEELLCVRLYALAGVGKNDTRWCAEASRPGSRLPARLLGRPRPSANRSSSKWRLGAG